MLGTRHTSFVIFNSNVQLTSDLLHKISYILALARDTAMKQSLADSPMADVYSNLLMCKSLPRKSHNGRFCLYYISMGNIKVGVTLHYFNLRSRYKCHSMQLVKSYLLISEHIAIVLLIAAESATKIWRLDVTTHIMLIAQHTCLSRAFWIDTIVPLSHMKNGHTQVLDVHVSISFTSRHRHMTMTTTTMAIHTSGKHNI